MPKAKLSDKMIAALAVDKPTRFWDIEMPNLVLVALPTGTATFYVYYSLGGRKHWLKIDNAKSVRTESARLIALKTLHDIRLTGKNPVVEIAAQRTAGTVSELITAFLRDRERKGNKSVGQTERLLRGKIEPRLGNMLVSAVTRSDIRKIAQSMDSTPIMANQVLAAASTMFNYAMSCDEFRVTSNPCKGITRNQTKDRERTATAEEIAKVWPHMPDVCKLIMLTGLRPGEAMKIRSDWIEGGFINLPAAVMKGGVPHDVPIFPAIEPLIEVVKDRALRKSTVADAMRAACKAAEIADLRPHDCRRTWTSFAAAAGVPYEIRERCLSHLVGTKMSRIYNRHDFALERRQALEKTAERILYAAAGQTATVSIHTRPTAEVISKAGAGREPRP
jgi:integrase